MKTAEEKNGARILVVDDSEDNRELLALRLKKQGYQIDVAEDGEVAMRLLRAEPFDLVLLDVMMPRLDGPGVLRAMKHTQGLSDIPVIVISAVDDVDMVVRCIELGAQDYLGKPFDPVLLRARIHACLEKKALRDKELENQLVIARQLSEAATYVRSLLPVTIDGEIRSQWRFIPSAQLGGDSFGHHWLNPETLAIYLLDVTGHGVGAALLSVTVMSVLRSKALPNTDFMDPSSVLGGLCRAFPREAHNNKLFSLWYGVLNIKTRRLVYGSGGHPPALLVKKDATGVQVRKLDTLGLLVGCLTNFKYRNSTVDVEPGTKLYVYSDGAYEIEQKNGEIMDLEQFVEIVKRCQYSDDPLEEMVEKLYGINGSPTFADDLSILEISA